MIPTHETIVAAIRATFPDRDVADILAELDRYGSEPYERERERVQLAILRLSLGNEEKLQQLVREAKTDYRDVLCWADNGPLSEAAGTRLQEAARHLIKQWGQE